MDGHHEHSKPEIGDLAKDTTKDQVGILMGIVGGRYLMRPATGGREWEVEPDNIDFPSALEEMRARNSARNRMTRIGL